MKNKIIEIINRHIEMETAINKALDTEEWWHFKKSGEKTFSSHTIRTLQFIKNEVQKLKPLDSEV